MLRGSQPVISSSQASSGACLYRDIKKCAVWQTSDRVLETDGFCVRDAAQFFLGLGKRTQVLHNTSNKRSTLCDPDNTFHTNAFSSCFSFLNRYTCRSKKNTTFHSRTLVFARSPIPTPFTCCPMSPRSGLMNLFVTFSKWQLLLDVRFLRLFHHTETLFRSFVHQFDTALSQIRIFASCLVRRCLSQQ